jgi:hypothetical protein
MHDPDHLISDGPELVAGVTAVVAAQALLFATGGILESPLGSVALLARPTPGRADAALSA